MERLEVDQGTVSFVGVETTGLKGGDAGYGGRHVVEFSMDSGSLDVEFETTFSSEKKEEVRRLQMIFHGDWELQALYGMLQGSLELLKEQVVNLHGEEEWRRMEARYRLASEESRASRTPEALRQQVQAMHEGGLSLDEISEIMELSREEVETYTKSRLTLVKD